VRTAVKKGARSREERVGRRGWKQRPTAPDNWGRGGRGGERTRPGEGRLGTEEEAGCSARSLAVVAERHHVVDEVDRGGAGRGELEKGKHAAIREYRASSLRRETAGAAEEGADLTRLEGAVGGGGAFAPRSKRFLPSAVRTQRPKGRGRAVTGERPEGNTPPARAPSKQGSGGRCGRRSSPSTRSCTAATMEVAPWRGRRRGSVQGMRRRRGRRGAARRDWRVHRAARGGRGAGGGGRGKGKGRRRLEGGEGWAGGG
jgi:hypothetical protein